MFQFCIMILIFVLVVLLTWNVIIDAMCVNEQ